MTILVTGATGFLGKRVVRKLTTRKISHMTTSLSDGCDLRKRDDAFVLFERIRPDVVLNCASYIGGIQFGIKHKGETFYNNMFMILNLLESSREYAVKRLVNPISNCTYPANATLFREEEFWDGRMHDSVETYGFVRKASYIGSLAYNYQYGVEWINLVMSNMYGPEDHFDEERSHALGALVMKIVKAKEQNLPAVTIWGTGEPVREWLYVDDGAEAMIRGMEIPYSREILNVGVGKGISIRDLAYMIKGIVGYEGKFEFDTSKPDGAPYKTMDGSRLEKILKWKPATSLEEGVRETVEWYQKNLESRKNA